MPLLTKNNKKSTKSLSKNTKVEAASKNAAPTTVSSVPVGSLPATPTHVNMATTPTTSMGNFDASFAVAGHVHGGLGLSLETANNASKFQKTYSGFDSRSIKIFWEQHDQTNVELSQDVCARVSEDASYRVWEVLNHVKTNARHSGGIVTYNLVNEVLKDANVPPMLGAMDSDYDCIDYDGSYFFHSDKIFELRDEYQNEISLALPNDADFNCSCPVENKRIDQLKQYVQNLVTAAVFGDAKTQNSAISHAFQTPLMGACYRAIVNKMLQMLAFKQHDELSQRCWRLLRACNYNGHANNVNCRMEYFNLAEVLISQLMATLESIKVTTEGRPISQNTQIKKEIDEEPGLVSDMPMEEVFQQEQLIVPDIIIHSESQEQTIYHLQLDDDSNDAAKAAQLQQQESQKLSNYFACPVSNAYIEDLCQTIGQLAAQSGYLHNECLFLIKRRLARLFETRDVCSDRDFKYLGRAIRGLIALGEYAFREFIPYIYNLNVNDIPDSLWRDLAPAAIFLGGRDDIHLYEWLEYGCGAGSLQPFLLHFASKYMKLISKRFTRVKQPAYRLEAKPGVRRLEWSTLAANMCHGDDPNQARKPKSALCEVFSELIKPNLQLNCAGTIRFKFAGCRPVLLKPKNSTAATVKNSPSINSASSEIAHSDILIAKRKLFKPLTNVKRIQANCGYHYLRI